MTHKTKHVYVAPTKISLGSQTNFHINKLILQDKEIEMGMQEI